MSIRCLFTEKQPAHAGEADALHRILADQLGIFSVRRVRLHQRYLVEGLPDACWPEAVSRVFSEAPVDTIGDALPPLKDPGRRFAWAYLPGQFDQRADSAEQALRLLAPDSRPVVRCARVCTLEGDIAAEAFDRIKTCCINPVDTYEVSLEIPETLVDATAEPAPVPILEGFRSLDPAGLARLASERGLAMDGTDLAFVQTHFRDEAGRDPTETELRMLDTYWSDHCRHTTFLTEIASVDLPDGLEGQPLRDAWAAYLADRKRIHGDRIEEKPACLMDLATLAARGARQAGKLDHLEVSAEVNAASLIVEVEEDGSIEPYLLQFKNETHNHPTEIEPFGGAATCLGGAIRDPLAGRAYVYQAMRVTGSGDPRQAFADTLPGKLPQRVITREAARGYSSYGNQIGIATGHVHECYHPGYVAKRMEIGAVIGAVPRAQVRREEPRPGDRVLLLGGATGRDGIGGATGSSQAHETTALKNAAEVQKGNPPEERKLLRMFRDPAFCRRIRRCNDFGAGGISVAVGEIADGLEVDLDRVPLKYTGLNGSEIALSESQERMAIVVDPADVLWIKEACARENLACATIATVTEEPRVRLTWRGTTVADLDRRFLDTSGVRRQQAFRLKGVDATSLPLGRAPADAPDGTAPANWGDFLAALPRAGQPGLSDRFDSSIGGGAVLNPWGGKTGRTPELVMVFRIPGHHGPSRTASFMSFGYDPDLARVSPFHGGIYAIVQAIARLVAAGGDPDNVALTLQEYFPSPRQDPERWGLPLAALLGAHLAQTHLAAPAVGGKDSMSGSFNDRDVPPGLIAFAVTWGPAERARAGFWRRAGSRLAWLPCPRDTQGVPVWSHLQASWRTAAAGLQAGTLLAARAVGSGGLVDACLQGAWGENLGLAWEADWAEDRDALFGPDPGGLVVEVPADQTPDLPEGSRWLATLTPEPVIALTGRPVTLDDLWSAWTGTLEPVFPMRPTGFGGNVSVDAIDGPLRENPVRSRSSVARPRVVIPVFPGTNCEWDTVEAFRRAGADPRVLVFRNQSPQAVEDSLQALATTLEEVQMLMLPGGFSLGDEPDGSGKYIAAVLANSRIRSAVERLLSDRDGLILGICNGFQALIKSGLLPDGEIREAGPDSPTLAANHLGRHVARYVHTRICQTDSPWLSRCEPGEVHTLPVSHGEGRLVASAETVRAWLASGQVATQYCDAEGSPSMDPAINPNGSVSAIEGLTSPDGRIFGKMAHTERTGPDRAINVPGNKHQPIFEGGVSWFR
ncbi:MAG: phosphoribosylformylglycinamidine synthase [Opitutales bacterium]